MNADEFLALVEKHPLPWDYGVNPNDSEDRRYAGSVSGLQVPLDWQTREGLTDAAPALAAAVIRYLRAVEAQNAHVNGPMQGISPEDWSAQNFRLYETTDAAFTALRAALPEAMRP